MSIQGCGEISESSFKVDECSGGELCTKVALQSFRDSPLCGQLNRKSIKVEFSAHAVYSYLYTAFLQRLIVLKGIVGDFSILVVEQDGDYSERLTLNSEDLPNPVDVEKINLVCSHGNNRSNESPVLQVTRYSIPSDKFNRSQHEVALCANSAMVISLVKNYLKKRRIGVPRVFVSRSWPGVRSSWDAHAGSM